jgi:mRNA interferase HigB
MRVITKGTLLRFIDAQPQASMPVLAWWRAAIAADWRTPHDLKAHAASVSIITAERAVFNLGGNKYRLVEAIAWQQQALYIKFLGTHAAYDRIDPATVEPEFT